VTTSFLMVVDDLVPSRSGERPEREKADCVLPLS